MNSTPDKLSPSKWRYWLIPILMLVCLYFMAVLGFSDTPLFVKTVAETAQGQNPTVSYSASWSLIALIVLSFFFFGLFFVLLRQWAHYYLNRKMILSYLFFAIIPLVTTTLILFSILRSLYGITNTLAFEKVIDQQASEMENLVESIQKSIQQGDRTNSGADRTLDVIEKAILDLRGRRNSLEGLDLDVYLQTTKIPGQDRLILDYFHSKETPTNYRRENTEAYEAIVPTWIRDRQWTGIISLEDDLSIRHCSFLEMESLTLVFHASIPIDKNFLAKVKGVQAVNVELINESGTRYLATDVADDNFILRLLLRPFATTWDTTALDWVSGLYETYGTITFEMPTEIGSILDQTGHMPFFHTEQKKSSLHFILVIALLVILCELVAFVFGGYLVSYITRSLNTIARGHENIAQGQLNYRLPYLGKDQLGAMGRSFNAMVSNIESLMTQVAEKEKYHEELRIARDIQRGLLPNVEKLDWCSNVAANCIPAHDVGGDYFEILQTAAGELGIFIADVSGKGTSAAFYMAELKGVLIALRHLWSTPRELMLDMNEILQPALSSNVFISAAYLLLDPVLKTGILALAGHCPAFHIKPDGTVTELMPPGIAIGIARNEIFGRIIETESFHMGDDDKVVMYTDGLDEMTYHKELYGVGRLKAVLSKNAAMDVHGLRDAILTDVLNFLAGETQDDDLTLVVSGLPLIATRRELVASRSVSG